MRSFFKIFFASLLALVVFFLLGLFLLIAMAGSLASSEKEAVAAKSVLVLDLAQEFKEQAQEDAIGEIVNRGRGAIPGLYDVIRLIRHAETDNNISGIYIEANGNANGFAPQMNCAMRCCILKHRESL
jgi:protease-4